MKLSIISFALAALVPSMAQGKAYFQSRSELISKATVIAIIELEEPEDAKPLKNQTKNVDPSSQVDPFADHAAGKEWGYSTQAKAKLVKLIKGEAPKEFILYGGESFICAQCTLSKGRFLVFLRKDGRCWAGSNWHLSLRPIKDELVEWFVSEEQRYPMSFQKLEHVEGQIQATLKKQQSEQVGADQPATAPQLKSEGEDKPNPKAEVRPR